MDRRTKVLAMALGVLAGYGLIDRVVYPQWISPWLTIEQRIEQRQKVYDELLSYKEQANEARKRYRDWVARIGSFNVGRVETDVRDRLNKLIAKHRLAEMQVSQTRPTKVGKTDIMKLRLVVRAVSTLQSAIEFLADVSQLPQLVRIENAKIYPASTSRRRRGPAQVNLTVPIEVWVLPQQKMVGRIQEKTLSQPELFRRHQDRSYAQIWEATPFREYVPPVPLRALAGRDLRERPAKARRMLNGSATGGDGQYTYRWEPAEGLSDPTQAKPRIDISKPFTRTYTLTVSDGSGRTAGDTVQVVVAEPPKQTQQVTHQVTRPPPKPVDHRWKDRKYIQFRMALLRRSAAKRIDEVMVYNNRKKKSEYYAVGDEFDGGELVFVHPTGGVVRRSGEYFIYPIGGWLDQDIPAEDPTAAEYPRLKEAVDWIREHAKAASTNEKTEAPTGGKENPVGVPLAAKGGGSEAGEPGPALHVKPDSHTKTPFVRATEAAKKQSRKSISRKEQAKRRADLLKRIQRWNDPKGRKGKKEKMP